MKLENDQHERFCQEFIIDLNITKSAERAKYSKKTAAQQGSRLFKNVKIQERIAELKAIRSERTAITQDMIIKELAILAFSDFRDYGEIVKKVGIDRLELKTFNEIKGKATRAIKSISEKITKDGVQLSFKLHGKTPAIELLGKHLGMFIERMALAGEDGGPVKIQFVEVASKNQGGNSKKKKKPKAQPSVDEGALNK